MAEPLLLFPDGRLDGGRPMTEAERGHAGVAVEITAPVAVEDVVPLGARDEERLAVVGADEGGKRERQSAIGTSASPSLRRGGARGKERPGHRR